VLLVPVLEALRTRCENIPNFSWCWGFSFSPSLLKGFMFTLFCNLEASLDMFQLSLDPELCVYVR
jgi:hypothetical protein